MDRGLWKPFVKAIADCYDAVTESNEGNNARTEYLNIVCKPDLITQDISWSPSNPKQGDTVTINVKTKNQGSENAGGFDVCYYVDGSYYAKDYVSSLSAGSTTTTSFSWTAECGNHAIKAVADCYNAVAESKEENNWMSKGGLNIPCKPDLIIQDISWDKSIPKQGDTIIFTVKIENRGDGNAGSSTVKYYIDDSYVTSDSVSSLSAGSTSTQTFTWKANKCGDVKVRAVADANKNIEESDETNNEKKKSLNIKCPELPDLIVESITWKIKDGTENTVEVSVTIKNQGEAPAGSFTVDYYVDDVKVGYNSIASLSKGSPTARTFEWNATGKSPGDHEVKVIADVGNKVKERSEDNNVKTTTITCIDIEVVDMEIVQVIKSSKLNNNLVQGKPAEVRLTVKLDPAIINVGKVNIKVDGLEYKGVTIYGDSEREYDIGLLHNYYYSKYPAEATIDVRISGSIKMEIRGEPERKYPDPKLDNNHAVEVVIFRDIKEEYKPFKIGFVPIDDVSSFVYNLVVPNNYNFIKKVYPLPPGDLELSPPYKMSFSSPPPHMFFLDKEYNPKLWNNLEKMRKLAGLDRLVGVVSVTWPIGDWAGYHKGKNSVLIVDAASKVVAAHEIGHTFCLCEEYKANSCVKTRLACWFVNPNAPGVNPGEDPKDVVPSGRKSDAYPWKTCMMGRGAWICPNCYIHLFKEFIGEPKSTSEISSQSFTIQESLQSYQSPTEVLFVSGIVWKNGSVEFYSLERMRDQIPDQIIQGNYSIECLDADGKVLSETPFEVSFYTEYGEVNVTGFAFTIPYQSGTKKVVVKYNGELKDEFVLSANSPTVSVIAPNGGESFSGSFTVTWTASDPDGDELSYTLLYSNNEGADWSILGMDINETSHAVNTSMLGGGTKCMVKVIASDGANTAEDTSNGCFTVETKNPIASISSPENNSEFMEWDRIEFSGFGYDLDDGILSDDSLVWTSSIDGVIGYGSSFTNSSLPAGMHLITLTARDSEGETTNATIVIKVLSRKPTPIFNFTPSKIFRNQRVTFNASLSYDLDGNITNYEWDFGDGTNGTGVIVNHSYTIPGKYNVVLTVTDNDGLTNSTTKEITIDKISEVIFEDDFSELNLNTWIPFGSPSPHVLASVEGRTGVFDNNGDANCNSGVVSKDNFSFPNGFTMESDIYLKVTNVGGCWDSPVIGLTRQNEPTGEGVCPTESYPMGVIFGTEYDGDACWATPSEKRRHAYFIIGLYTENGTWESVGWLNADDYTDAWHNFKIAVGSDRIVKFYVDNDLIYTSEKRINETVLQEKKIFLGIRSSCSAGKSYHDYVKVYALRKGEQKTIDIPIRSGKDDGYFMTFVSDSINDTSDILIGQVVADIFSLKFSAFMRFPNVAIPKDAKITKAYITVVPTFTNQSGPLMKITATDQSNPTIPKDYSDYSNRLRTKASVDWDASNWNEGVSVNSPDISSVIQELVDSYDYLTGAPILFFLDDADTEMRTKSQLFAAYEHTEHEPAKLHIEYITGGESESPLKMTITSDKEVCSPRDTINITTRFEIIHATPEEPIIITNPISTIFTIDGELVFEDVSPGSERHTFIAEGWLERGRRHTIPDDAPEGYYDVKVSFSGGKYVKTAENLFYVKADDVPGDVTGDGRADYKDLVGVIEHWGAVDIKYDVDRNGAVDYSDIVFILEHWTGSEPYRSAITCVHCPYVADKLSAFLLPGSSFRVQITTDGTVEAAHISVTFPSELKIESINVDPGVNFDSSMYRNGTDWIDVIVANSIDIAPIEAPTLAEICFTATEEGTYTINLSSVINGGCSITATFGPHEKHWVDTMAPTISNIKVSPTYALPGDSINISANVFDSSGIRWVRAFISKGGEHVVTVFMSDSDGDGVYTGTWHTCIFTESGIYNVDISATDTEGNETLAKAPEVEIT